MLTQTQVRRYSAQSGLRDMMIAENAIQRICLRAASRKVTHAMIQAPIKVPDPRP